MLIKNLEKGFEEKETEQAKIIESDNARKAQEMMEKEQMCALQNEKLHIWSGFITKNLKN